MAEMSHSAEVELSQASVSESRAPARGKQETRPVYEVGFHIAPTVPEDGVAAVVEEIRTALGEAEIISEHFPQKMTLAYTVERSDLGHREKSNEAYFGFIKFALERQALPAFEDALRAIKDVLRFLLIETVREELVAAPRRAVFSSDRLEGETIKTPVSAAPEEKVEVSEEELDKSIEALVN
ncbi:MAG: 30S ribosomal protein S6 [bacterium]|nr:30S ribosomal protein S6 [bacterium]